MGYPKGSEWRKWDLHIHSIYSQESSAKLSPKDIFEAASVNDITVISITDHSNVDGLDEALDVWENGVTESGDKFSDIVTFFPGVELKAEVGQKGVHFLAILPPVITAKGYDQKIDQTFFKESILAKIGCSESDIKESGEGDYKKGLFSVAVNFEKTAKLIRSLGGVIIVHNGNKASSLEDEIDHPASNANPEELLNTLGQQKKKLMEECVDICELPNWSEYHQRQEKFYRKTFNKPSVVFSDSHKSYENICPTWIKADPTFEGLRQVLHEPKDRICIQNPPEILEYTKRNKPHYIQDVSVRPISDAKGWFNDTVVLNSSLVAIIGNKGTGKSALADIISLLGDTKQYTKFSFLKNRKFRDKKTGQAQFFEANMTWLDGEISGPTRLDKDPQAGSVEKIKYLPQNFIEDICSDLSTSQNSLFYQELQGVIFSHLEEHQRLGCDFLAELLAQESEETEKLIQVKIDRISDVNAELVELQRKQSPEVKIEIENKLSEKTRTLQQIFRDKPALVSAPSAEKDSEHKDLLIKIFSLQQRAAKLEKITIDFENQRIVITEKVAKANKLLEQLKWVSDKVQEFRENITALAGPLDIDAGQVFQVKIKSDIVEQIKTQLLAEKEDLDHVLSEDKENSIPWELTPLERNILKLQDTLSKPEREHQEYRRKRLDWRKRVRGVIGSKLEPKMDSIRRLQQDLSLVADIPDRISGLEEKRLTLAKEIFQLKHILKEKFRNYHKPVQDFISTHPIAQSEAFPLSFTVSIAEKDFTKIFFEYISQGVNGSFCGAEQGQQRLLDLLEQTDFNKEKSVFDFLAEILASLREDKREGQSAPVSIVKQLKKNTSEDELFNMLFALTWLQPVYNLEWDNKGVEQLSPGERGQLLLIFYLLIDQEKVPLIIDQPEENLDNQTVYQVLVPCIKEAKSKRQVILVTHNPNLAVVCDAEQIICVQMDKAKDNKISYITGAIENPEINKKIVEILEGTKPAFMIRESKYQFSVN